MDKFQQKFLEEATDNINDLEEALLELERSASDPNLVERVFRAMHSLKGGGSMFGFKRLSEFTHHMETIYDGVRGGKIQVSGSLISLTLESVDLLRNLLNLEFENTTEAKRITEGLIEKLNSLDTENNSSAHSEKSSANHSCQNEQANEIHTYHIHFKPNSDILSNGSNPMYLLDEIASFGHCEAFPYHTEVPELKYFDTDKCYLYWEIFLATKKPVQEIADVFLFVENDSQLIINKLGPGNLLLLPEFLETLDNISQSQTDFEKSLVEKHIPAVKNHSGKGIMDLHTGTNFNKKDQTISSIRVASEKVDDLMNLVSELVITQARLTLYAESNFSSELENISENIQKITRQLRDNAFSISLIPLASVLTRFQRLARDLSAELGKEIEFLTEGAETEFDKTIIDNLTDPILHIIRNCIDHGIEVPEIRLKKGKNRTGRLILKAFHSGPNVIIEISDDGAGINIETIRKKAIETGIITAENNLTQREILNLIFLPGFSTAKNVTDVSGRGVGMDVVKRKINDIRGEVEIDSEVEKGTKISIKLPLTLSIIDGLLVQVDNNQYVIPLSQVDSIHTMAYENINTSHNNLAVINGERIPFYNLREEFHGYTQTDSDQQVVIVKYENVRIGIFTDKVLGEYQAVLKSLGKFFKSQDIFSGATILGDGTIALVLDINKLISQLSNQLIQMEVKL